MAKASLSLENLCGKDSLLPGTAVKIGNHLNRDNNLLIQILFSVLCCGIAFLLIGWPLILTDSLYWDYPNLYSFFRNSFLSVLRFGEIRWWDPTLQYGFPSYYLSFLGLYGCTPLFWATEGALFLLHGLGIEQINIFYLVVFYTAFLVPLLFTLSFLSLSRQIFTAKSTVLLTIVMAAFSPSCIFSTSVVALELSAYGMFTAAALLAFLRHSTTKNYLLLNLASCILLLTFNHPSLFWNLLFLPMFLLTLLLFPDEKRREAGAALPKIPARQHLLFVILLAICALPTIMCFLDGTDILRSTLGRRSYSPMEISRGTPIEILLAGIPGTALVRNELTPGVPTIMPTKVWAEYIYIGALTLPLALLGLIFGKKPWRLRLFLLILFFTIAVLPAGYSALLSIMFLPDSPFRAVDHFSDMTFKDGLFALLILAAGLGYEALIFSRIKKMRQTFFVLGGGWLLAIAGAVVAALYITFAGRVPVETTVVGYMATLCFFYLPFLFWVWLKPGFNIAMQILFICLVFLDLSCSMYLYERFQVLPQAIKLTDSSQPFKFVGNPLLSQENNLLILKDVLNVKGQPGRIQDTPYLGIVSTNGITPINVDSPMVHRTFNRLIVTITNSEDAKLIWRDSWFKWWRATVNGKEVPIEKYLGIFKAVPVRQGKSVVAFTFRPQPLYYSLIAGWACILVIVILIAANRPRRV